MDNQETTGKAPIDTAALREAGVVAEDLLDEIDRLKMIISAGRYIKESEYRQLIEAREWLECLEEAGVDNWEGYDYAAGILRERGNT